MTEHQSSRTLVKSAPELWAECSDAGSLARHLGAFGEIRITKFEPESTVAWEGAAASGTVVLEPSGWGTRVTLTVTEEAPPADPAPVAAEPAPEPVVAEPEPAPAPEPVAAEPVTEEPEAVGPEALVPEALVPEALVPEAAPRPGVFARFRLAFRRRPEPEPAAQAPEQPDPDPVAEAPEQPDPEPVAEAPAEPEPEAGLPTGEAALTAALDSLGMAHHRPYSRA
jgi:hypothetical protein